VVVEVDRSSFALVFDGNRLRHLFSLVMVGYDLQGGGGKGKPLYIIGEAITCHRPLAVKMAKWGLFLVNNDGAITDSK
jgi:hypothetical protein